VNRAAYNRGRLNELVEISSFFSPEVVTTNQFLVAFVVAGAAGTLVFFRADRNGIVCRTTNWVNSIEGNGDVGSHFTKEDAIAAGLAQAQQSKTEHVIHTTRTG
jgi:Uncharacterized protein conserved in bacteria (DUF2188)